MSYIISKKNWKHIAWLYIVTRYILQVFQDSSKMAQFIYIPININNALNASTKQISQIVYHAERLIEIMWQADISRVLVQDNGTWFYLYSPDIPHMTLLQVLQGLGYGDEQIIVTWNDNTDNDVLNSFIEQTPLNQIAIYGHNQQVPDQHPVGPFPTIAGQAIPNIYNADEIVPLEPRDDDDDQSTITYPSSDELENKRNF